MPNLFHCVSEICFSSRVSIFIISLTQHLLLPLARFPTHFGPLYPSAFPEALSFLPLGMPLGSR